MTESIRGARECRHYQHAEFGGMSRPGFPTQAHTAYSRECAILGCPRCIDETLRRIQKGTQLPLSPAELNDMQLSVNHTLDGYWMGKRQQLIEALWAIAAQTSSEGAAVRLRKRAG